jgi:hypothetical protein
VNKFVARLLIIVLAPLLMGGVYNLEEENVPYGVVACGPWFSPCFYIRIREIGYYITILVTAGFLFVYNERRPEPRLLSVMDQEKGNEDITP